MVQSKTTSQKESGLGHDASLITLKHVYKRYETPSGSFTALSDINIDVKAGEYVAVLGKSGSGKSTLINMITGIDSPTSGAIRVGSTSVHELTQEQLAAWRGRNVGVVFQFFQLLPTLTVAENIMLPMDFCGTYPRRERRDRAEKLLERLGILRHADKMPSDLSGGEQQRAAIARALANDPPILVADEPTGNLDSATSQEVLESFKRLAMEGKTVIMVSHERDLGRFCSRTVTLSDGAVMPEPAGGRERQ